MYATSAGQPGNGVNWLPLIRAFIVDEFIPRHIPKGLRLQDMEFELIYYYVIAKCYLQSQEAADPQYQILRHQSPAQISALLTGVLTGLGYQHS